MNKKIISSKPLISEHPIYKGVRQLNSTGFLIKDIEKLANYSSYDRVFAIKDLYFEHEKKYPTIEEKSKLLKKLYDLLKKEPAHIQHDINSLIHGFTRSLRIYKRINTKDLDIVRAWNKLPKAYFQGADKVLEEIYAKETTQPTEMEINLSESIAEAFNTMKQKHTNEPLKFTISSKGKIEVINGQEQITKIVKIKSPLKQLLDSSATREIKGHVTRKKRLIILDSPKNLRGIHLITSSS